MQTHGKGLGEHVPPAQFLPVAQPANSLQTHVNPTMKGGHHQAGLDAKTVKAKVDLLSLIRRHVPDLRQAGREWEACCPFHEETGPSFKVDPEQQLWNCFGCGKGGDAVAFVQALRGCGFQEALAHLAGEVAALPAPPARKATSGKTAWQPTLPVPENAPPLPSHYRHGAPSRVWTYHDAQGRILGHVCRFDRPDGGKEVMPLTFCQGAEGKASWRWQGLTEPRPLYNLHLLSARPDVPVLVCEGEKAADAAMVIFPEWVATTSPNGSMSPAKADWSPLAGRRVIIWPDHDEPGRKYADQVGKLLRQVGVVQVHELRLEGFHHLPDRSMRETLPDGWDAADAVAEGYGPEQGESFLSAPANLLPPRLEHNATMEAWNSALEDRQAREEERRRQPFEIIEWVEGKRNGVYWRPPSQGDSEPEPVFVCSPLRIVARTRDTQQKSHGRVLEFDDADGHRHQWVMPMSLLAGDGTEYRAILLAMGLELSTNRKARGLLDEYIQRARPEQVALCVERTGWQGGAFVLPDGVVGPTDEMILFQTTARETPGFKTQGTLTDWQAHVAARCAGNSRLVFAVSMAFAAPLLALLGEESGGFNLVGGSSTGKSTALRAACSVWGEPGRKQSWRATANGLEAVAQVHNDTLLCLDELAQVEAREAGEAAYLLANGAGKARAGRDGSARVAATWRVLFLSAGEIGLTEHMRTAGKRARAGQEIRLADIPADAGAGLGLFEALHGHASGGDLAVAVGQASSRSFGTAARAFLDRVTTGQEAIPGQVEGYRRQFLADALPLDADGQAQRVAARFALVAATGELATAMGITGWEPGEATRAARQCLGAWLDGRGGSGPQEEQAALAQVRLFFERHGESRFTPMQSHPAGDRPTINRAGFRQDAEGRTEFFVLPEVFRSEVCEGLNSLFVARLLARRGWIVAGADDKFQVKPRLPGMGPTRCYRFTAKLMEDTV